MTHQELLDHIYLNPDKHRHKNLDELTNCCLLNGAIDSLVWQAHEGIQGRNGGKGCDVLEGPCSCGAWH